MTTATTVTTVTTTAKYNECALLPSEKESLMCKNQAMHEKMSTCPRDEREKSRLVDEITSMMMNAKDEAVEECLSRDSTSDESIVCRLCGKLADDAIKLKTCRHAFCAKCIDVYLVDEIKKTTWRRVKYYWEYDHYGCPTCATPIGPYRSLMIRVAAVYARVKNEHGKRCLKYGTCLIKYVPDDIECAPLFFDLMDCVMELKHSRSCKR